jgi:hypothetical protein
MYKKFRAITNGPNVETALSFVNGRQGDQSLSTSPEVIVDLEWDNVVLWYVCEDGFKFNESRDFIAKLDAHARIFVETCEPQDVCMSCA